MATADASIYSQIKPFTMEDPLSQAAKAMQVKAMGLQVQDAERKFTLEDDISGALAASGGDLGKASTMLAQRGRGTAALTLGDKDTTRRKTEIESKLKIAEAMGSDAITLDSAYRNALSQAGGDQAKAVAAMTPVYAQVRQKWAGMGQNLPEQFDPVGNFAGIGQAKELTAYLKSIAPEVAMVDRGGTIQPMNKNPAAGAVGPLPGSTEITKTPAPATPTELARLQGERAAIFKENPTDPRLATYDRVLSGYKAGKGDTNVTIQQPGPMVPGKPAQKDIDEGILNSTKNLMQLDVIAGQFKPEYQRFMDRAGYEALSLKDKSPLGLNNKEKADLEGFAKYRRNAFSALNDYIKSVTGAAMSEAEAQRILKGLPNPGSGLFDGDSPTEFKGKMEDAIKQTKMAAARFAYMKRNGMSLEDGLGKGLTLESMPELMNKRGAEIEAKLKEGQKDIAPAMLKKAVRRQLSVEFGLSAD